MPERCIPLTVALLFAISSSGAQARKPDKIPVAFGAWKGPHANTFKGGLRRGLKECAVVKAKAARVIIEGAVTEEGKKFLLHLVVKSPKSDEIVESRDFSFSKPTVSPAQSSKMGRDVTEIVRRAPTE